MHFEANFRVRSLQPGADRPRQASSVPLLSLSVIAQGAALFLGLYALTVLAFCL